MDCANLVAPHNPTDLATLELSDALMPPAWLPEGRSTYLLGTDAQGRDILSALMYGTRISLMVGVASVLVSMLVRRKSVRRLAYVGVVLLVVVVCLDRVLLGRHYPSDVVAGIALGTALAGASYLGYSGWSAAPPDQET